VTGLAQSSGRGSRPHAHAPRGSWPQGDGGPPRTEGSVLAQGNHRPRATGRRGSSERCSRGRAVSCGRRLKAVRRMAGGSPDRAQPRMLVLGIDGGGTRCTAVIATAPESPASDAPLSIFGRGLGGPANPRVAGFEAAQANLAAAVAAARTAAGIGTARLATAYLGPAGVGRAEERDRMTAWVRETLSADHVAVVTDAEILLAAATLPAWGVVLIAGTGSLALGCTESGATDRCGGWGPLLGDEGSGYWIAVAGLRTAARRADGRGPATSLLAALQQRRRPATQWRSRSSPAPQTNSRTSSPRSRVGSAWPRTPIRCGSPAGCCAGPRRSATRCSHASPPPAQPRGRWSSSRILLRRPLGWQAICTHRVVSGRGVVHSTFHRRANRCGSAGDRPILWHSRGHHEAIGTLVLVGDVGMVRRGGGGLAGRDRQGRSRSDRR
jgi:hypothetical protein